MLYFMDSEFIERGSNHPIDLISIALVCEDGRELYMQSVEHDPTKASDWVKEHVLDHLVACPINYGASKGIDWAYHTATHGECGSGRMGHVNCPWRSRHHMRSEVIAFMDVVKYGKPELVGWCCGYDWVALCQLFGTMMDLPPGYPHYMRDLQQVLDERGISDEELPEQEEGLHHALHDARHLKRLWGYIVRNDCWQ